MARQGLPKDIIKEYGITKKAWRIFRARKKKKSRSQKVTKTRRKKRRNPNMARRKRRNSSRKFTLPLAPIAGLAAGLWQPAEFAMKGDWFSAAEVLGTNYTGYSIQQNDWQAHRLARGLLPLIIGGLVHKFVGGAPLNINRMLARAGVPVIRI